jgi:folylpolyglutamate synthase/dihydropteroate synthase
MPAGEVAKAWSDLKREIQSVNSVGESIELALSVATASDLICITGSIYLVGAAMTELGIEIPEV